MSQFNSVINLLTKHLQFNLLLAAYLLESMITGYIIYLCKFVWKSFNLYMYVCCWNTLIYTN